MKTVIVASHNPIKLQAVRAGFTRMFPAEEFQFQAQSAPSGVPDQPFTSTETLTGARNRAAGVRAALPQADYWVGVEGGVELAAEAAPHPDHSLAAAKLTAFAWVVVLAAEREGRGRTGLFFLPPRVTELVMQGKELGEADDIVFGRTNSKQASGAVGLLTGDLIDRAAFYEQAVVLALIPFKNPELY